MTKQALPIALAIALCLSGCGRSAPPKDQVISAMQAVIPAQFKVSDADVEYSPTGESRGEAKVKLTIAPKEDLFVTTQKDPQVVDAARREYSKEESNAAVNKARANGLRVPEEQFNAIERRIAERNRLTQQLNGPWLKVATKANSPITVYGSVQASYEFKEWRFSKARLDQQLNASGEPRSGFPPDALLVGSPEAEALANKFREVDTELKKALDAASEAVDRLVEENKKKTEQQLADRKAALLRCVKPGTKYSGSYLVQDTSPNDPYVSRTLNVEFTAVDVESGQVKALFLVAENPALKRIYEGRIVVNPKADSRDVIELKSASPGPLRTARSDARLFYNDNIELNVFFEKDVLWCMRGNNEGTRFSLRRVQP